MLALGDSFVEGFSVPFDHTVTQVLERAMAGRGCAAETVNAGTVGYSTDQEFLFYLRYGVDEAGFDRGAVLARLREIAAAERIPLLDLTPAMREATGPLSWPYYDFDSHWNALGHKIAAEQVDGFLRRQGWDCASR